MPRHYLGCVNKGAQRLAPTVESTTHSSYVNPKTTLHRSQQRFDNLQDANLRPVQEPIRVLASA